MKSKTKEPNQNAKGPSPVESIGLYVYLNIIIRRVASESEK
jgi:hypothetical protein